MKNKADALFLDCASGISGDMLLAALFDLGLDFDEWRGKMETLSLSEKPEFVIGEKEARGVKAKTFRVNASEKSALRTLKDMEKILDASGLSDDVKKRSAAALRRLAECEAGIHGVSIDEVHFHELGGLDTVVDVAGAFLAIEMLGIKKISSSAINTGTGTVKCAHGEMPVPAPATAALLKGAVVFGSGEGELTTPTGALLATELAKSFGDMPRMTMEGVGCGTGTRDYPRPSLFRVFSGDSGKGGTCGRHGHGGHGELSVISTNIDDMEPRAAGYLVELLLQKGALDAYTQPVFMKKNRPAFVLTALCETDAAPKIAEIILRESTTLGVRVHRVSRICLDRKIETIDTKYGKIRIKYAIMDGEVLKINPEYDDCANAAAETGEPILKIIDEARATAADIINKKR